MRKRIEVFTKRVHKSRKCQFSWKCKSRSDIIIKIKEQGNTPMDLYLCEGHAKEILKALAKELDVEIGNIESKNKTVIVNNGIYTYEKLLKSFVQVEDADNINGIKTVYNSNDGEFTFELDEPVIFSKGRSINIKNGEVKLIKLDGMITSGEKEDLELEELMRKEEEKAAEKKKKTRTVKRKSRALKTTKEGVEK